MDQRDLYISWLKDAHSMEKSLENMLEKQVDTAEGHPEIQQKIEQHLEETRRHAEAIESCLERHGESPSKMKEKMSSMMGSAQVKMMEKTNDTLVKTAIANYAAEHFEIASYKSLVTAAERMGDMETAHMCHSILQDEEAMAHWLEEHIAATTQETMREQALA